MTTTDLFAELLQKRDNAAVHKVRIEFDGGTPCNIPARGYGLGYGSYQIRSGEHVNRVARVNFDVPMSANVAEISTLIRAIRSVMKSYNPENTSLEIHGDSKIALNRCSTPLKRKKHYDSNFAAAVTELQSLTCQFASVTPSDSR